MKIGNTRTASGRIAGVGTAVTGARLYCGCAIPELAGKLVVTGWSASFKRASGQVFAATPADRWGELLPYRRVLEIESRIASLAEDADGEIVVLTNDTFGPYGNTGKVFRLVAKP